MKYDRDTTLCFSGHRRYDAGPEDGVRLTEALMEAYRDGYRVFISGVAEGFDLAAAEAVLSLRELYPDAELVAAVPFREQSVGFSDGNRLLYEKILAEANHVAVLSERYRRGCYYTRDDWMITHSSRLVCWYDGSAGGTRYTVKGALRNGLDVVNIYRKPGTLF